MQLKERFIKRLNIKLLIILTSDKNISSIWESMKGKHFLINMGKNILASSACFLSLAGGWECRLLTCQSKCALWSGVRMLAGRSERELPFTEVYTKYLFTQFFSTPASSCQNAISEIVERMESVQPGEQKTQEKTKGAWALYSVNRKAVMGKGSCLALFQSEHLHWINVVSEWISAPRLRKPASLLHKPCVHHPSFPQIYSQNRVLIPRTNSPTSSYSPSPEVSLQAMEVLFAVKG